MESTDEPPLVGPSGTTNEPNRLPSNTQITTRFPLTPGLELREMQGSKPGSRYVRVTRRSARAFERVEEGEYRATALALRPRTGVEGLWRRFKRLVVGAPLATSQLGEERLTKLKALAIFASDNLSSSAYATEEMLLVLVLAGTVAFSYSVPIAIAIAGLTAIVALSYIQVIRGYPNGGGAYVVAKENLGLNAGLVAGASLIADYVLLVAVSVAAGVAAMTSALPELHNYRIEIGIGFVVLLTLGNLRGIRESASFFAIPTYVFIAAFGALLATGFVRLALGHDLTASTPDHVIEPGTQAVTLFIILRAFASGSAALTGIEAISNGVPAMKPPEPRNAVIVLAWMVAILGTFFVGTTVLAHQVDVVPSESTTVIAQIAEAVFGKNAFFYVLQLATMFILILAANTSFAGLPSLTSVMASDRVLPRQFSFRGDRLAFSHGIVVLGLASAVLLAVFRAETHALIPLYAVGVFVGFTLSQAGLVLHWSAIKTREARLSLVINAAGALITGVVMVVVAATKFVDGAWITIGGILILVFAFQRIHQHYRHVEDQLDVPIPDEPLPVTATAQEPGVGPAVVVPVDEVNRAVLQTLDYARSISGNITAVHITDQVAQGERLRDRWARVIPDVPLLIIESPYRSFLAPMLAYIDEIDKQNPGTHITVALPEFVPVRSWEGILHNQTAVPLKRALLQRPHTVIIDVPYHLN